MHHHKSMSAPKKEELDFFHLPLTTAFLFSVVVVTGGAKGIGKGVTAAFARAGAKVMVVDIDELAGQDIVKVIIQTALLTFVICLRTPFFIFQTK